MKKIFYIVVTRSDTYGGVHRHIDSLITFSQEKGFKPIIICGGDEDNYYVQYLKSRKIEVITIQMLNKEVSLRDDLKSYMILKRLFKNLCIHDIVSIHSSKVGILARLAVLSTNARCKCYFTVHGWSYNSTRNVFIRIVYILLEWLMSKTKTSQLFVANQDLEQGRKLGLTQARAKVIRNSLGKDEEFFYNRIGKTERKSKCIIMVARLDRQKDHSTAIKAMKAVEDKEYKLILVGDGPLRESLEELVKKEGLQEVVEFHGFRKDVYTLLHTSQIFLLCTNWEGLPFTCIEALAAGLPMVVTDVGGNRETVKNGINGYLVRKNSVSDVTISLNMLIRDVDRATQMGIRSRELYNSLYATNRVFKLLETAYLE